MLQKLKNISGLLLHGKGSQKKIVEEQVQIFLESLAELFDNENIQSEAPEYSELAVMVEEMWHYHEVHALSPEEAFLYGGIWGAVRLESLIRRRNADKTSMEQLIRNFHETKKAENCVQLLTAIEKKPGIKHKDLAEKLAVSPSELSQIISRLEQEKLFMAQRSGREKYYFLREKGKEVLKRLRPKDDEPKLSGDELVIITSNHDDMRDLSAYFSERIKSIWVERLAHINLQQEIIADFEKTLLKHVSHYSLVKQPRPEEWSGFEVIEAYTPNLVKKSDDVMEERQYAGYF